MCFLCPFGLLIIKLCNNQDESDELTTEVKQLIMSYNNIVSFKVTGMCIVYHKNLCNSRVWGKFFIQFLSFAFRALMLFVG